MGCFTGWLAAELRAAAAAVGDGAAGEAGGWLGRLEGGRVAHRAASSQLILWGGLSSLGGSPYLLL